MIVKELPAKSILSKSKIFDYVINPYTGCAHRCSYCYARFMKRFTGHKEPWGQFIDVKVNAPELLSKEIEKKRPGRIWMSGVCDPYQPVEARYRLTRRCLQIVVEHGWPLTVQTRSALVVRDIDLLTRGKEIEVGLSIATADDMIRRLFEPHAPSISQRIIALDELHRAGIRTYAMIAPLLPKAEMLVNALAGKVDFVLVDRMNYNHADWVYRKHRLDNALTEEFFHQTSRKIASACLKQSIECRVLFA
jgi:DNA repair photolyase